MIKVAVPSRDGQVDEHFGHCQYFTVVSVDDAKNIVAEETFTPDPGCGCKSNLVSVLSEMGVSALVAGNMGQGAVAKLGQGGVKVTRGAFGPVREAVQAWLDGRLKDNLEVCTAHGHECGHDH